MKLDEKWCDGVQWIWCGVMIPAAEFRVSRRKGLLGIPARMESRGEKTVYLHTRGKTQTSSICSTRDCAVCTHEPVLNVWLGVLAG